VILGLNSHFGTISAQVFPDTRKRVYSVVDLFCGHRAISKAFENRGLKSMAHDVCINVLDVPMVAI
jgi:hypothetical protein